MMATVAVRILAAALLGWTAAARAALVEWHEQVVPGACTLRFAVAQGWDVQAHSPMQGAVNLDLQPLSGPHAKVRITGTVQKGASELMSTSEIKRAVKTMGEALLAGSVEKRLELTRVDGRSGSGFFYSLADKRAELPEGEFRHMTQGIMAVGSMRLAVTVLSDQPESAAQKMALDLLRTADCEPPPAR
jgi:hypothetical protein